MAQQATLLERFEMLSLWSCPEAFLAAAWNQSYPPSPVRSSRDVGACLWVCCICAALARIADTSQPPTSSRWGCDSIGTRSLGWLGTRIGSTEPVAGPTIFRRARSDASRGLAIAATSKTVSQIFCYDKGNKHFLIN